MAHLKKSPTGHLLRGSSGHLVNGNCGVTCQWCTDFIGPTSVSLAFTGLTLPTACTEGRELLGQRRWYRYEWGGSAPTVNTAFNLTFSGCTASSTIFTAPATSYFRTYTDAGCSVQIASSTVSGMILTMIKLSATLWRIVMVWDTIPQLEVFRVDVTVPSGDCVDTTTIIAPNTYTSADILTGFGFTFYGYDGSVTATITP